MHFLEVEKKGLAQIKSKNRVRVYSEILRHQPISRTQLETALSLSPSTVSRVVEQLIKAGIVKESGTEPTAAGRKPIMLSVRDDAYYIIGLSITKKRIVFGLFNVLGEPIEKVHWSTIAICNSEELLSILERGINQLLLKCSIAPEQILTIGIAARGLINKETGSILYAMETKEWIPVKEFLNQRFDCPVYLENNVAADLKAQYLQNSLIENAMVYMYMDEGIGGSIIYDGKILDGQSNMAARFGHLTIIPDGKLCSCGKKGHLEAYVTNSLLIEAYRQQTGSAYSSLKDICFAANQGDTEANLVIDDALKKLSFAISQILVNINPGTFVLYGELFEHYNGVIESLKEEISKLVFDEKLYQINWIIRNEHQVQMEQSIAKLALEWVLF
ncbi:ROK family transcriptional regulator [Lacrimispora defluvii]|uniref:ROK family transcriptional regulator n=1 Tax=Lacrimispora defluvii TaxID=2719233 RepID=A0ABX1VLI2_9FIRM|nr:ROK family transcriptional regulator [Lacrimispora defluvii]NNJ29204.1 ROK family transcriptional regulator [Lacrimispora defluvii]